MLTLRDCKLSQASVRGVFSHIINLLYTKWSPKNLFPPTARVANISNSLRGPRLCAADDLEFSYDTEQIDLFYNQYTQRSAPQSHECSYNNNSYDFYNGSTQVDYSPDHQSANAAVNSNNSGATANANVVNVNAVTTAHPSVAAHPTSAQVANGSSSTNSNGSAGVPTGYDFGYDSALDFSYHNLPVSQGYTLGAQVHPSKIESHYQWNMSNAEMEYNFNDFQKTNYININNNLNRKGASNANYAALMSTNTSSLQSSDISPLDDEFFKKLNSKKDPTTNMMELVDQLFHNYLAKNDAEYQFAPSSSFLNTQNNLEQRDSVVSESSVGSIEQFDGNLETPQFRLDSTIEPPFPLAQRNNSLDPRPMKREREDDDLNYHHNHQNHNLFHDGDLKPIKYLVSAPKRRKARKPKPDSYDCPHCDAKFKVKGYLTRHIKKHNSAKAFTCPFYQDDAAEGDYSSESTPNATTSFAQRNTLPGGIVGTKCHPTGGFTRRDTFKTHLKALHFIYPPGTKLSERNLIEGRCAGCFQHFKNNAEWLESHIERGECQGSVRSFNGSGEVHSHEHTHDQLHYVQL